MAIFIKLDFPYDVVLTVGILRFPWVANEVWYWWVLDENVNQSLKVDGNLLWIYLLINKQFSILTLSGNLIILDLQNK